VAAKKARRASSQRGSAALRHNAAMPDPKIARRAKPAAAAFMLWELWWRLPPQQRRFMLAQARKHGPKAAKAALKGVRRKP
jgi:hypothetical protein